MTFDLFIVGFTVLINSLLGLLVLIKNRKPLANKIFLITVLFVIAWAISNYNIDTASSSTMALLWLKLFAFFTFLFIYAFFVFIQVFSSGKFRVSDPLNIIMSAFMLSIIPFLISDKIFAQAYLGPNGLEGLDNGSLFILLPAGLITMTILNIFLLVKKYRQASKQLVQSQILYFAVGWCLFFLSLTIVGAVLPSFFPSFVNISKIIPMFSIFMVGLTTYAILRHQFLDIRIIIQRGLIYLVLLGIIAAIYISGLQLLGYFFGQLANVSIALSAGITMVLGIFFFRPLEEYFREITDPIFFKGKYNYADALHRLSKILNTNLSQTDIIAASSLALKEIFRTAEVTFRFPGAHEHTAPEVLQDGSVSVPIIFESRRIGAVELGPKRSGDSYNSRDMQLLQTFAYQAAIAIEKGRLYEKVEEYSTHLEQLVKDRTLDIKCLQEEQKQIMIDISHNLQTPLAVIKGELESLSGLPVDKGKISAIEKSLTKVSDFIRQLLHLARIEGSSYDADFSKLDLSVLAREQIEYFEVMAKENEVDIISNIPSNVKIVGNKQLLGEMLTNLVSNAIKYRNTGAKSVVTISLKEMDQSVQLSVQDNGIGIAPADLPKIFTCFFRTSDDSRLPHGVGLGLAIVERIALKHQGTISVSSTLGKGTEFLITFPKANQRV